jgi:divalent metal cation (Fe/Co/Zn/Cd) transporter
MDRAVDEQEVQAIRQTLLETPGVSGVHDVRTRKMGDMIVVDATSEVDASITVEAGTTLPCWRASGCCSATGCST